MTGPRGADPERLVADALRAQATGAPRSPLSVIPAGRSRRGRRRAAGGPLALRWILLIVVLVGAALGVGLALVSLLAPGVLPALG